MHFGAKRSKFFPPCTSARPKVFKRWGSCNSSERNFVIRGERWVHICFLGSFHQSRIQSLQVANWSLVEAGILRKDCMILLTSYLPLIDQLNTQLSEDCAMHTTDGLSYPHRGRGGSDGRFAYGRALLPTYDERRVRGRGLE